MKISTESPENFQQKCCVAFVLDVSGSMSGNAIEELNKGLQEFHKEILDDSTAASRLEIAIVEFSSSVSTLIDPSLVENFSMPTLVTNGSTKLVDGVREGIQIVKTRKQWYKDTNQQYYRPWVILITDGEPDGGQDVDGLKQEIENGVNSKDFYFFAVGVENANMNTLVKLSSVKMAPAKLHGLKFKAFFEWLSASLGSSGVTGSIPDSEISFPDPRGWMAGLPVS
jgi:uncharacterized protein YegL